MEKITKKIYGHRDKTAGKYPHDDTYTIEGYVRMKSPESGEWYDAVLYKSTTKGEVFCRERCDFEEKFKEEAMGNKKKEFAIGEEFQMGLKRMRCIRQKPRHFCRGCYFYEDEECHSLSDIRGYCSHTTRKDGEDVIFVEVE